MPFRIDFKTVTKTNLQPIELPKGALADPIWAKITLDTKKI